MHAHIIKLIAAGFLTVALLSGCGTSKDEATSIGDPKFDKVNIALKKIELGMSRHTVEDLLGRYEDIAQNPDLNGELDPNRSMYELYSGGDGTSYLSVTYNLEDKVENVMGSYFATDK